MLSKRSGSDIKKPRKHWWGETEKGLGRTGNWARRLYEGTWVKTQSINWIRDKGEGGEGKALQRPVRARKNYREQTPGEKGDKRRPKTELCFKFYINTLHLARWGINGQKSNVQSLFKEPWRTETEAGHNRATSDLNGVLMRGLPGIPIALTVNRKDQRALTHLHCSWFSELKIVL